MIFDSELCCVPEHGTKIGIPGASSSVPVSFECAHLKILHDILRLLMCFDASWHQAGTGRLVWELGLVVAVAFLGL